MGKDKALPNGLIVEFKGSPLELERLSERILEASFYKKFQPVIQLNGRYFQLRFSQPQDEWDKIIGHLNQFLLKLSTLPQAESLDIPFEIRAEKADEHDEQIIRLGNELTIVSADSSAYSPDNQTIVMETGWAFGGGGHPTTKFCLEGLLLLKNKGLLAGKKVLDIGTGTAILALAAVKLGCSLAVGVDISDEALNIAKANISRNNLKEKIYLTNSIKETACFKPFDIILANLIPSVIENMLSEMVRLSDVNTIFILSGFSPKQKDSVISSLNRFGIDKIMLTKEDKGWALVIMTKSGGYDSLSYD